MRLTLYYKTTVAKEKIGNNFDIFSVLLFLVIFLLPAFVCATTNDGNNLEPKQEIKIRILGDAMVFDANAIQKEVERQVEEENLAREKIVKDDRKKILRLSSSKIVSTIEKIEEQSKINHKTVRSKFNFVPIKSDQNLGELSICNSKNSVSHPRGCEKALVFHHYTELTTPIYIFLLNIYTAEFRKTATLSQSFFSRPPPFS